MEEIELQNVWRHVSPNRNSMGGFLIWEVRQVIGSFSTPLDNYFKARDRSWLYVSCNFTFSEELVEEIMADPGIYQINHIV